MKKHFLLILCGLPFAGKTTLAKKIEKIFSIPRIDLDRINRKREIGLKGRNITPTEWQQTYEISYKQAQRWLGKGKSVVYDATNFTKQQREKLKHISQANEAKTIIIYVNVSEKEARRQLEENRKKNLRYDVKDEDFNQVTENFQHPTPDEGIILTYGRNEIAREWIKERLSPLLKVNQVPA